MNKAQFEKHINKIQTFMWLDNWVIESRLCDIDSSDLPKWQKVNAEINWISYTYFKASIKFDFSLLNEKDDYIIHVICHEFSHIYTSNTLGQFEEDRDYYEHHIWAAAYISFKNTYNTTNEQQTEFLARRFKELYLEVK